MSKLIVLRGPSGAGKSTVSKMLFGNAVQKTGLFEQDFYRHQQFNLPKERLETARKVMFAGMKAALDDGADVIAEGIMSKHKYDPYFADLLHDHPEDNFFFYFDVSLAETVRRHLGRDKINDFSVEKMSSWYDNSSPFGYPGEVIIGEHVSAIEAYEQIVAVTGIVVAGGL